MKRKWFTSILIGSLTLSLIGCAPVEKKDQTNKNSDLKKISIMLDWYPNAVHSAIYTAESKGYFKNEGLDVDIEMPAETNDPIKLVAAGKVDLALSYQPQIIESRAQGIPVVSLATLVRHPLDTVMVPKKSGISSPRDLEGKNIGYPSTEISEAILQTMVKNDEGNMNQVKMTDVGWDLIPAIATKRVDGIIGGYINHEKILLEKQGQQIKTMSPTDYGVPDYYELVLAASESGVKAKKTEYKKFWKAVSKGQRDVEANPDKGLETLFKHENKGFPLDRKVEEKSLKVLLPLMNSNGKPFGYQEKETWKKVSDWMYDTKVIKEKVDINKAYLNITD
jgi:putative hydroxymethylpyrimidine transport system substrate-binding protein